MIKCPRMSLTIGEVNLLQVFHTVFSFKKLKKFKKLNNSSYLKKHVKLKMLYILKLLKALRFIPSIKFRHHLHIAKICITHLTLRPIPT